MRSAPRPNRPAATRPAPARRASRWLAAALFVLPVGLSDGPGDGPRDGAPGVGDEYYPELGNGGYDVESVRLDLAIDVEAGTVEGEARLVARAEHGLRSFRLDLSGLDVREVLVRGEAARFSREERELVVVPAEPIEAGRDFDVRVRYGGAPAPVPTPSVPMLPGVGWMSTGDAVYLLSQPNGAASLFPSNDHPSDKALYELRITADRRYSVVANGRLVERTERGADVTWLWRVSEPMASYLLTIAVAEFDSVTSEGPAGLPLVFHFHRSASPKVREAFGRTAEMIEFFSARFGPYPFESYGAIVSDLPIGAALETQTIPTYGAYATGETTQAHELVHQWFGNAVSVERWRDIWLSEGFATYGSWLWMEAAEGRAAFEEHVARTHAMISRLGVGPPAAPGVEGLFGPSVYQRGALALAALHRRLGDARFFGCLRSWVQERAGGHGTIDEFLALVEERGGDEAAGELRRWLYEEPVPELPPLGG